MRGDHEDVRPYRRFAKAFLNMALRDARTKSFGAEVCRFFTRPTNREVLVVTCDLINEDPEQLRRECLDGRLPRRLPRRRIKR